MYKLYVIAACLHCFVAKVCLTEQSKLRTRLSEFSSITFVLFQIEPVVNVELRFLGLVPLPGVMSACKGAVYSSNSFHFLAHQNLSATSRTCRQRYIPNLMHLALTSDGVHFLDSNSLSLWLKHPCPHQPRSLSPPPPCPPSPLTFSSSSLFVRVQIAHCLSFWQFTSKHLNRGLNTF